MKKKSGKILVLRTCKPDMTSYCDNANGFKWPEYGPVKCTDWDPDPKIDCGNGLHGLAWGDGNWSYLSKEPDAKWLVVEVEATCLVESSSKNKVRFLEGFVTYCGSEAEAVCRVMCGPENTARIAELAGKKNTASGNYGSASASGYYGSASASGDSGRASASGDSGSASASGYSGSASASGNSGRASASGNYGSASASGYSSIAATLCHGGTVRAGPRGLIIACWWDEPAQRYHACVGEVGIDGIEANTDYVVKDGKLTKAVQS
jgi:hypothetical protein